jgi:hypothetical protein
MKNSSASDIFPILISVSDKSTFCASMISAGFYRNILTRSQFEEIIKANILMVS